MKLQLSSGTKWSDWAKDKDQNELGKYGYETRYSSGKGGWVLYGGSITSRDGFKGLLQMVTNEAAVYGEKGFSVRATKIGEYSPSEVWKFKLSKVTGEGVVMAKVPGKGIERHPNKFSRGASFPYADVREMKLPINRDRLVLRSEKSQYEIMNSDTGEFFAEELSYIELEDTLSQLDIDKETTRSLASEAQLYGEKKIPHDTQKDHSKDEFQESSSINTLWRINMNVDSKEEYKRKQPERLEAFNILHRYWRASRGIGKDPTWIPFWKKSDLVADCHVPYVEFDDGSRLAISTALQARDFIAQYEKDTNAFSQRFNEQKLRKEIRKTIREQKIFRPSTHKEDIQ